MSQIEEIRAFVMVVETGSLTQAAERLGIAVSAVSRRLKDLELRLGAPLIQRTTRRMYLNEVGQGFYERCKAVLDLSLIHICRCRRRLRSRSRWSPYH